MLTTSLIALVDCNNFFVSCERIFRPDLEKKPVVVMSSNDGCIIARSNEAKLLGIPMGLPAFKLHRQPYADQVISFSANVALYSDISNRIVSLLSKITPNLEIYSIDECFMDLTKLNISHYTKWGRVIHQRILTEIGVPVSIGIARTKTLAKLASEHAKHDLSLQNVLDFESLNSKSAQHYLQNMPVENIWGVGRRYETKLRSERIFNAQDLKNLSPHYAKQLLGVHGQRLVAELNNITCYPIDNLQSIPQTIMRGRSFGQDTNNYPAIESAITKMTSKACLVLRQNHLLTSTTTLTLSSSRYKPNYQQVHYSLTFTPPTADSGLIASKLVKTLALMINPNIKYHKVNIILQDLKNDQAIQLDLLDDHESHVSDKSRAKMIACDLINQRYGQSTILSAAELIDNSWQPKQKILSPGYTTNWQELPIANIKP